MNYTLRAFFGLGLSAVLFSCNLPAMASPNFHSLTAAPSIPATLPASIVPPATATPAPIARVASGDKAFLNGDVDAAALEYRSAFEDSVDPAIKAAALWGLARAQFADQRHIDTLTTLQLLIMNYSNSPYGPAAYFLQGETYSSMQRNSDAAAAYQTYLTLRPGILDFYVQELRGDALSASGNYSEALIAYTTAQAAPHLDDAQALLIKIGQTRAQPSIGDYNGAIATYSIIAANTTNDYIHSQMDYLSGEADLALNRNEEAYGYFRHAVTNYSASYYSYLSLVELVNAKAQISDLDRGETDYFAGQYNAALLALERFIRATPGDDGTAHYYHALTLEALQNYQGAIAELDYFIKNYPANPKWGEAWSRKSRYQWSDLNQYPEAAATLIAYVKAAPSTNEAAASLMSAARLLEEDGRLDEAGQIWVQVGTNYPGFDQAPTAVFYAGIMQFRQSDYSAALPLFQRSLSQASALEDQARAYLWIGKTQQKLKNMTETQSAWHQAQNLDPGGYYSERARDLLAGQSPFAPPLSLNLNIDHASERKAADSWMRLTFNLPADTDLTGLGPLATDPRIIRGTQLWNLDQYDSARLEFEDIRNAFNSDPIAAYRLANYMIDLGLYRSGIFASRQVLTLAGLKDYTASMLAPPYFSHLRYGLYFPDVIVPAAQSNNLNPLFLFSMVRQESLFEGFVRSTAGARGLMQIVPSTGKSIAGQIGWPPSFYPDQLYRPKVSIVLGSYYLAENLRLLNGDLYGALAAYNGGPGNASGWERLSGGDTDLLLESIRFDETRQYIRNIYEIYVVYRRLYGPSP